jgi:hypothetical protein
MPTATAAVEPVAWDPHGKIPTDTPLSTLPVTGLACATAGLDADTAPLLGLQTADGPDGRASLFRPDKPLPATGQAARSLAISHVTPDDLAHGRSWPIIRPRLADYLGRLQDGAVVTHNAGYHLSVLAARHLQPPPVVCTMRVALALGLPLRLHELAYTLSIDVAERGPSTGGADALTPVKVWRALVGRLADRGVTSWGDLLALEVRRAADRPDWRDQVRAAWRRGGYGAA